MSKQQKVRAMKTLRTVGTHSGFQELIVELDAYLSEINGQNHPFFRSHNSSLDLQNVVLIIVNNEAVACGAFKEFTQSSVEIKRMFVKEPYRKSGLAKQVLQELHRWAHELGYQISILETSKSMVPAVNFYLKFGFKIIKNYGPYVNVKSSVCFEMPL